METLKRMAESNRWEMITREACEERRREQRRKVLRWLLERLPVWFRIGLFLVGLVLAGAEGPSIAPNVLGALLMLLSAWKMRGIALALMLAAPVWIIGWWVWRTL